MDRSAAIRSLGEVTNGTQFLLLNRQHVREHLPPAAPVSREAVFIPDRCAMPIQSVSSLVKPSEPVKPVLSLVKPFEPAKPIPGLSSKPSGSVTPSLSSTPSLPVRSVVSLLDHAVPAASPAPPSGWPGDPIRSSGEAHRKG